MSEPTSARTDDLSPALTSPRVRVTALLRVPAMKIGAWILVVSSALTVIPGLSSVLAYPAAVGAALLVVALIASSASPTITGAAPSYLSPVRGYWQALATPASIVPSRGTADRGQSYALILVADPDPLRREKPSFGNPEAGMLAPERFPGFGEPVHAMADGVIVHTVDHRADHRSRLRWGARIWQHSGEALLRFLGPESMTLGNHVVVQLHDGSHLVYAHLRRGSVRVSPGQRVAAGEVLGGCGSSGFCAEPQLRVQRQDRARSTTATGLPWAIHAGSANGSNGFPPKAERWNAPQP
ncbi:MAG: M23 family metallopeptidase [Mycetocola sp.]